MSTAFHYVTSKQTFFRLTSLGMQMSVALSLEEQLPIVYVKRMPTAFGILQVLLLAIYR
jgi:hypothetical protein